MQWRCGSKAGLEGWHALMRWLRPRVGGVGRLSLTLSAGVEDSRRARFRGACTNALRALGDRLAGARRLEELSVVWDPILYGDRLEDDAPYPLVLAALLGACARSTHTPLAASLTRLELSSAAGGVLAPSLRSLRSLRCLCIQSSDWDESGGWTAGRRIGDSKGGWALGEALQWCLPPSLTALHLHSRRALVSLAGQCDEASLAAALPSLRELRVGSDESWGRPSAYCSEVESLVERLAPSLGSQLEVRGRPLLGAALWWGGRACCLAPCCSVGRHALLQQHGRGCLGSASRRASQPPRTLCRTPC